MCLGSVVAVKRFGGHNCQHLTLNAAQRRIAIIDCHMQVNETFQRLRCNGHNVDDVPDMAGLFLLQLHNVS